MEDKTTSKSLSVIEGTRRNTRDEVTRPLCLTGGETLYRLLAQLERHLFEYRRHNILLYKCPRWTRAMICSILEQWSPSRGAFLLLGVTWGWMLRPLDPRRGGPLEEANLGAVGPIWALHSSHCLHLSNELQIKCFKICRAI